MQAASGLNRFEAFLNQPAVRGSSRCIVASPGGGSQEFEIVRPRTPPGLWGKLIGSVLYAKLFGTVSFRATRMRQQEATLREFRHELEIAFGPDIAREASRPLAARFLRVDQAQAALRRAHAAAEQREANLQVFEESLRFTLASPQASAVARACAGLLSAPGGSALARQLAQVLLGPALVSGPLRTRAIQAALAKVLPMLQALQHTPGMSPQRAVALLKFAARVPGDTLATAIDLCRLPGERQRFDARGVATASGLGTDLVPATFQPAASSRFVQAPQGLAQDPGQASPRHALLLQNFGAADLRDAGLYNERPQRLHGSAMKDSNRADYMVNGKPLPRDQEAFPAAFRAGFPPGPEGDALSTLASACANQFNVHPIVAQVANDTVHPLVKDDERTLYEVTQHADGQWTVRATYRTEFSLVAMERGHDGERTQEVRDMARGSALMHTVEFVIVPGESRPGGEVAPPRLASVHTDVVFTGAPAPASVPVQAS